MAGNSFFATTTGSANNAFHVVFCFVKCACAARSVRSCSGILRFMSLPSNSHRRRHSHYYRRQAWQCFCGDPLVRSFILLSNCLEMNDAKMLKRFPCFSFYGIRFLLLRPLFKFVFIRWHSKTKFLSVCEKASLHYHSPNDDGGALVMLLRLGAVLVLVLLLWMGRSSTRLSV